MKKEYIEYGALISRLDWDADIEKWVLRYDDLEKLPHPMWLPLCMGSGFIILPRCKNVRFANATQHDIDMNFVRTAAQRWTERATMNNEVYIPKQVLIDDLIYNKNFCPPVVKYSLDSIPELKIVYCKYCRYLDPEDKKCEHHMSNNSFTRKDNDFCSYGERRNV